MSNPLFSTGLAAAAPVRAMMIFSLFLFDRETEFTKTFSEFKIFAVGKGAEACPFDMESAVAVNKPFIHVNSHNIRKKHMVTSHGNDVADPAFKA